MDANELRLNNWVSSKTAKGKYIELQITPYRWSAAGFVEQEAPDYKCPWNPIPLTEEWLLKLGFEQSGMFWHCNGVRIWCWGFCPAAYHTQRLGSEDEFDGEIEFVHDLQNYYYYFNNRKEELKIK